MNDALKLAAKIEQKNRTARVDDSTTLGDVRLLGPKELLEDHGGVGPIQFRRVFDRQDIPEINFIDFTEVPPGSRIGLHCHRQTVEVYLVFAGHPLVEVNHRAYRLHPGGVSVVHSGGTHSLFNDTNESVELFVFEVDSHAHRDRQGI